MGLYDSGAGMNGWRVNWRDCVGWALETGGSRGYLGKNYIK
jgi:hypothetical protein